MIDERLTTGEAAKKSGLSVSTIKRKIQSKALKAARDDDGEWLIQHGDLMAFLTAQEPPTRQGASGRPSIAKSAEPAMGRPDEAHERALVELRLEKSRLEEKVERLEAENRSLMREYKAMMERMIVERDQAITDLRHSLRGTQETNPEARTTQASSPTRFLPKFFAEKVGKVEKAARAAREALK